MYLELSEFFGLRSSVLLPQGVSKVLTWVFVFETVLNVRACATTGICYRICVHSTNSMDMILGVKQLVCSQGAF